MADNNITTVAEEPRIRDIVYSGANATVVMIVRGIQVELDVVTINFTISQNKLPLYGYKSIYMDDAAIGAALAQGSFTLNVKNAFQLKKEFNSNSGVPEWTESYYGINGGGQNLFEQSAISPYVVDIRISYDIMGNKTGYLLNGVTIVNMQQVISPSGEPLAESYSFICRNISRANNG
ncbi:hypothetical protein [Acinetobacter sp.]|uniref:hypothetical protein n=1 Tax=Acinetobacter sp. TaxID=472 RepID=UPI003D0604F5